MKIKNIVFVHIPKTGGNSIKYVLRYYNMTLLKHNLYSDSYVSLPEYKRKNCKNEDCFSFTFVRNPWDRLVSAFFYLDSKKGNDQDSLDRKKYIARYNGNFEKFVCKELKKDNPEIFNQIHFRPQYKWITDEKGKLIVDFIGRVEFMEKDLNRLFKTLDLNKRIFNFPVLKNRISKIVSTKANDIFFKINFPVLFLPKINTSRRKKYTEYYTPETAKYVMKAYKLDIKLFKYSFGK